MDKDYYECSLLNFTNETFGSLNFSVVTRPNMTAGFYNIKITNSGYLVYS